MYYIIVGASRGLGAALTKECLKQRGSFIVGIGRTAEKEIENYKVTTNAKRFQYYRLDIADENASRTLSEIRSKLPQEPITIIFNAAVMDPDITEDGVFLYDKYRQVCRVGVDGLGIVLDAFGKHLLQWGGTLVGISSTSSVLPFFHENRVAYPAQKSFLNMALRCLRIALPRKIKITTILLGNVGDRVFKSFPLNIIPSYETVAAKIVRVMSCPRVPPVMYIPRWYGVLYKMLGLFPDRFVGFLFGLVIRKLRASKGLHGDILHNR